MAANLIKFILLVVVSAANADDTQTDTSSSSIPVEGIEYRDRVLQMSRKETKLALKILNDDIERCKKKEKRIDATKFKNLGIPFEELMKILYHLSMKARANCQGQSSREHYFYTMSKLEKITHHYGLVDKEVNAAKSLLQTAWRDFELEAKYNELEPDKREALEAMPELMQPFNAVDQMDEIEKVLSQ